MTKAKKTEALTGEVIIPDEETTAVAVIDNTKALNVIAKRIRTSFGKGIDMQFAIGRDLNEARALIPGDTEFGQWVAAQEFGFSQQTGHRLQQAALREDEVRAFIAAHSKSSERKRDIGVPTAIEYMNKQADEVGRVPQDVVKRVQALFEDEVEPTNGFAAWLSATEALNLQVLTVEELTDFAAAVKTLVEAYGAEKARRSA